MDILGMERDLESPGFINFRVEKQDHKLDVFHGGFVIFSDDTNGVNSYEAGRYVYINLPDEGGSTIIDFNKAYNPPCIFTDFAVCPLPPSQNVLSIGIPAGEKYDHSYL